MTLIDLISLGVYALSTICLGYCLLRAIRFPSELRNWASAYLVGQLLWLLLFLLASALSVPALPMLWAVIAPVVLWGGLCALRSRAHVAALWLPALLLVALCVVSFPHILYVMLRVPLVDWDARSIWLFHGKAIWVHGGISADFFASSFNAWSHTDYPLLIPVQAAVVAMIQGAWSEMAVKSFLFINFLAYFSLMRTILVLRGWSGGTSWAIAVIVLSIASPQYINGYADNHYAMPLFLAALVLFQRCSAAVHIALGVLLVGVALNTKNESSLYGLLWGGGVLLLWGAEWCKRGLSGCLRWVVSMGLIGGLPFLAWALFKLIHGIEGDLNLGSRLLAPVSSFWLCIDRAPHILQAMGNSHQQFYSPYVLGIAIALSGWCYLLLKRNGEKHPIILTREEQVLWCLLIVVHGCVFAVYGLTPYDVQRHLASSIDRVLVLPVLLLVGLLICALEKISGVFQGKRLSAGPDGM